MLKFEMSGKEYDVILCLGKYEYFDNTALTLETADGTPFAKLTVNLEPLPSNLVYLDTNNVPNVRDFIKNNGLGKFTGKYKSSGFCKYPQYELDLMKCIEVAVDEEWNLMKRFGIVKEEKANV